MNNKKFIMIGSPIISIEMFRNILRPLNNYSFKPNGGFWACELLSNIGNISDWYTYLLEASSIARYKNLNQSTIFTLKDNANILIIDTDEKVKKLSKKYPPYHHILSYYKNDTEDYTIFDYEKLSQDYDGIYVNVNKLSFKLQITTFNNWDVNSLVLFNLDCIKEYQTTPIIFDINNPYSFPIIDEDKISEKKKIEEEHTEHKYLSEFTKELLQEQTNELKIDHFKNYDEYLTTIIERNKNIMTILEQNEKEKIDQIIKYLNSKQVSITDKHLIQTIILNNLSKYLLEKEQDIKTLPKSKIKNIKYYHL